MSLADQTHPLWQNVPENHGITPVKIKKNII
jgi:hypothetical protein